MHTQFRNVALYASLVMLSISSGLAQTKSVDLREFNRDGQSVVATSEITIGPLPRQDFFFEEQYWANIFPGIWTPLEGWWSVDYNATIVISFVPYQFSSGYRIEVTVDPYMVRRSHTSPIVTDDRKAEFGDLGATAILGTIHAKTRGILTGGSQILNIPETNLPNGATGSITIPGSIPYGECSLTLELWNSFSNAWVSRTFNLNFENPDIPNQQYGYFVGSAAVLSQSHFQKSNPQFSTLQRVTHVSGTFRYYISSLNPSPSQTVHYRQVWTRVRRAGSQFGSYYEYAPDNMLKMSMIALQSSAEWSGLPNTPKNTWPIEITTTGSTIGNNNTIYTTTECIITPRLYQDLSNLTGTVGFEAGVNFGLPLNIGLLSFLFNINGSHSSSSNYVWLLQPQTFYFQSRNVTAVEDDLRPLHSGFLLCQNYPNPFNPRTTIQFEIPRSGLTELRVFDLLGREVTTLLDQRLVRGVHRIELDAVDLPSGVYLYRLKASEFTETKKLILTR